MDSPAPFPIYIYIHISTQNHVLCIRGHRCCLSPIPDWTYIYIYIRTCPLPTAPSGHTPISLYVCVDNVYVWAIMVFIIFGRPFTDESIWLCGHHTTVWNIKPLISYISQQLSNWTYIPLARVYTPFNSMFWWLTICTSRQKKKKKNQKKKNQKKKNHNRSM